MLRSLNRPDILVTTLAAAGILMVTMGARQSLGLSVPRSARRPGSASPPSAWRWPSANSPGARSSRWPAPSPTVTAARRAHRRPRHPGAGSAITPFMGTGFGPDRLARPDLGHRAGAGSFSVLIGAAAQRLPIQARGSASGVINAGGSVRPVRFAPILQKLIQSVGWMGAMGDGGDDAGCAAAGRQADRAGGAPVAACAARRGRARPIGGAMKDRSHLLLHAGSSPAASISPSWSPTCRAKSICAG